MRLVRGMTEAVQEYEAVIVGGGPAGLAAALWLARYRRRLKIFDGGHPRNEFARAVHGYPGLPDLAPRELRRRLLDQATDLGAEHAPIEVVAIEGERDRFQIQPAAGGRISAQRVLLAFGERDVLPALPGIEAVYGTSVYHCPDCDGPGMVGRSVGVIGHDRRAAALALFLLVWTDRVVLLTNRQEPQLQARTRAMLARAAVPIDDRRITHLHGTAGRLAAVELDESARVPFDALFCHTASVPASDLAQRLGCTYDERGYVRTDSAHETSIRGVYAAGDLTGHPHLAICAAADGVCAALGIHRSLLPSSYEL